VYSPHVSPTGDIIGVVAIIHDITERKRAEEQLLHNAFHDALTGLPNRALFLDRLERLLHAHATGIPTHVRRGVPRSRPLQGRERQPGSHDRRRPARLASRDGSRLPARTGDTVARLGGDEFAVLLDDVRRRARCDAGGGPDPARAQRAVPPVGPRGLHLGQHRHCPELDGL
jgi:predicted signal transduction protein with EAL and GGDEF domain